MARQNSQKRIFVIEDDEKIAELIKIVIEKLGFAVQIYADGETGRQAIFENPPDLVLLDLWLPGVQGETLAALLKTDQATKNIPIILISAQNNLASIARKIHANSFIHKPFNIAQLRSEVEKCVA